MTRYWEIEYRILTVVFILVVGDRILYFNGCVCFSRGRFERAMPWLRGYVVVIGFLSLDV